MSKRARQLVWALLLVLGAFQGSASFAAEPDDAATSTGAATTQAPGKKAPKGFEPVAGAKETDKIDPNPLVVGAYAMFFVVMFGYVLFVARGQASIAREIADLSQRVRKMELAATGSRAVKSSHGAEKT